MANALTICRIALSLALLIPPAFSPGFFVLFILAGATDMVDGYIARRTGMESEFGARLDSFADFVLIVVCLVKILPAINMPTWLWIWVVAIFIVKMANLASGFVIERQLIMLHTKANKVTGFVLFLVPFAIPVFGLTVPAIVACAVATFSAVQEGHFIRTGRIELPA